VNDTQPIAGSIGEVELGGQVALGCLNRLVGKREVDLLGRCMTIAGGFGLRRKLCGEIPSRRCLRGCEILVECFAKLRDLCLRARVLSHSDP
jgi:hypothetical protein